MVKIIEYVLSQSKYLLGYLKSSSIVACHGRIQYFWPDQYLANPKFVGLIKISLYGPNEVFFKTRIFSVYLDI